MSIQLGNFNPRPLSEVTFTVNGIRHTVYKDVPIGTTLNAYIRDYCQLKGTKYMCYEGGCGSCVVSVVSKNACTKQVKRYAVNSCLVPIHACQGWAIETIEGIGNKKIGYHKLQLRLAQYNGTQCGYCSPGMVMNMYSISEGKNITMKEVENSFGGNICRCTGYRPILDAFKSVCIDAPPELRNKIYDIEDLHQIKICKMTGQKCIGDCAHVHGDNEECIEDDFVHVNDDGKEIVQYSRFSPLHLKFDGGVQWFKAIEFNDIINIFELIGRTTTYMLIAGNTAQGVYRVTVPPQVYIDVKDVPELLCCSVTQKPTVKLGGNMSLSETIAFFDDTSKKNVNFSYLSVLANHIRLIANVPVRNIGTLAGNLMIKFLHNEFPSDLFLFCEAVGATLNIWSRQRTYNVKLPEFLDLDMTQKIIVSIELPAMDPSVIVKTYKIMIRAENAHAYVNAGFKFNLNRSLKGKILTEPTIVFGGINPMFIHASKTEDYLNGRNLFDSKVVHTALQILYSELKPDSVLTDASPVYRRKLACALFYKFILNLKPPGVSKFYISGGEDLERPLSSGKQDFETDQQEWPLTKPVPKLEAIPQCSGEAEYVNDIPPIPRETFAAFVITTVGQGSIANIDASEALKMPGVLKFLTAVDIPGKNSYITLSESVFFEESDEEILCSGQVKFAGQPLGIIVAETNSLAITATSKVKVTYSDVSKPVTNLQAVIASKDPSRIRTFIPPDSVVQDTINATHVIKGSFDSGMQYHFTMETQHCVCIPKEDGLDVFPTTQYITFVQNAISQSLNIQANRINIQVRRLGGAYGAKLTRNSQIAAACALAAVSLNRPVRFLMPLETNMGAIGLRNRAVFEYEVGTDDNGKIEYLKCEYYYDGGINYNEHMLLPGIFSFRNCYVNTKWSITGLGVLTDISSTTWCRAPGTTDGIAGIEHIMEHIAKTVNKDPTEVRLLNMNTDIQDMPQMVQSLKNSSEFNARKRTIDEFNKNNRWLKKGISLVPMVFIIDYLVGYYAMVSIYGHDGSVAVVHGGIECGQGLNTKVAQTVARGLGISLDLVSVKPSNNLTAPNNHATGGSIGSEVISFSAMKCCEELVRRMEPVKQSMQNPTWLELVRKSMDGGIDLNASHMYPYGDAKAIPYSVYGVAVTEICLEVLTGKYQIVRVDILEDAGRSANPFIDIGQVEGSFVMGLGHWLQEFIVLDPNSGKILTDRTWNYKPPVSKDIPIDFRIELRRNAPNPFGLTRGKAVGEPALCLSFSAVCALRHAIDSVRKDSGLPDIFIDLKMPATPENVFLACELDIKQFTF